MTAQYGRALLAAAVLQAEGVACLVAGSTALLLHGANVPVGDLDIIIGPEGENVRLLYRVLYRVTSRRRGLPPISRWPEIDMVSAATSFGKIDCLLERGRAEWERFYSGSSVFLIADAPVRVVSKTDAWALRRCYKEAG